MRWEDLQAQDMREVRRLAASFQHNDPTDPTPAPAEGEGLREALLFATITVVIGAAVLAWVVAQVVMHWAGAVQLVSATTVLTWFCLASDRALGAVCSRVRGWFR